MNNGKYQRRHYRVGEKATQEAAETSLIELDLKKSSLIIAIFCFIQGILIGSFLGKRY